MSTPSVKKIRIAKRIKKKPKKQLITKKIAEFKLKKKITKIGYEDVCAVPPLQRDLAGSISVNAFSYISDHLVSRINESNGRIPRTGESFSYGRIVHYLWRCHAAYQLKAGTFVGDVSNHQEYLNFCVPGYVATLFENSCVFRDDRYGCQVRLQDNNYDTNMHALIVNEGSTRCSVWSSNATANEPIFSNGVPVGYADLSLSNSREISDLIAKAFKHVTFIRDIEKSATRLNDLLGSNNTSFKPLSSVQARLTLATFNAPIFPCTFTYTGPLNWFGSTEVKALQWILQDYDYVIGRTINKMYASTGMNPYRFSVSTLPIQAAAFSALVATIIKETGAISPLTDGLTAWRAYVNNYIYLFTAFFSRFSWLSRSALNAAFPPTYVNAAMKSMYLPPLFAMIGSQPVFHKDTLVVPYFQYALDTSALISNWQSTTLVTASTSFRFPEGTVAFGAINTPMTMFANLTPYAAGIKYNLVPLNLLDDCTSYASTNAWNTVEPAYVKISADSPVCDCISDIVFSDDAFQCSQVVGNSFTINWLNNKILLSDCMRDAMDCVCSKGASLFTYNNPAALAMHAELVYTNTGEATSVVINAGIRNDNFDNMAAAMQDKDVGKAALSYFKSRVAQSMHHEDILVSADNFIDMVRKVAAQDLSFPVAPEDWLSRIHGTTLGQAVVLSAGAVATYGPRVYNALRRLTDVSVRAVV